MSKPPTFYQYKTSVPLKGGMWQTTYEIIPHSDVNPRHIQLYKTNLESNINRWLSAVATGFYTPKKKKVNIPISDVPSVVALSKQLYITMRELRIPPTKTGHLSLYCHAENIWKPVIICHKDEEFDIWEKVRDDLLSGLYDNAIIAMLSIQNPDGSIKKDGRGNEYHYQVSEQIKEFVK